MFSRSTPPAKYKMNNGRSKTVIAPVFRRISQVLGRAYAARWLVLRLRLRWIIHPGVFSSRVKQKHIMGAFYYRASVYVNSYRTWFHRLSGANQLA